MGQLDRELLPGPRLPPMAFDAEALGQHEAPAQGFQTLAFAAQLFTLTGDTTALFLLGRGHPDGGE